MDPITLKIMEKIIHKSGGLEQYIWNKLYELRAYFLVKYQKVRGRNIHEYDDNNFLDVWGDLLGPECWVEGYKRSIHEKHIIEAD